MGIFLLSFNRREIQFLTTLLLPLTFQSHIYGMASAFISSTKFIGEYFMQLKIPSHFEKYIMITGLGLGLIISHPLLAQDINTEAATQVQKNTNQRTDFMIPRDRALQLLRQTYSTYYKDYTDPKSVENLNGWILHDMTVLDNLNDIDKKDPSQIPLINLIGLLSPRMRPVLIEDLNHDDREATLRDLNRDAAGDLFGPIIGQRYGEGARQASGAGGGGLGGHGGQLPAGYGTTGPTVTLPGGDPRGEGHGQIPVYQDGIKVDAQFTTAAKKAGVDLNNPFGGNGKNGPGALGQDGNYATGGTFRDEAAFQQGLAYDPPPSTGTPAGGARPTGTPAPATGGSTGTPAPAGGSTGSGRELVRVTPGGTGTLPHYVSVPSGQSADFQRGWRDGRDFQVASQQRHAGDSPERRQWLLDHPSPSEAYPDLSSASEGYRLGFRDGNLSAAVYGAARTDYQNVPINISIPRPGSHIGSGGGGEDIPGSGGDGGGNPAYVTEGGGGDVSPEGRVIDPRRTENTIWNEQDGGPNPAAIRGGAATIWNEQGDPVPGDGVRGTSKSATTGDVLSNIYNYIFGTSNTQQAPRPAATE